MNMGQEQAVHSLFISGSLHVSLVLRRLSPLMVLLHYSVFV